MADESKYNELLRKRGRLQKRLEKLQLELAENTKQLKENCVHPAQYVATTSRQFSNGFGRWHERSYLYCTICRAENHWGSWCKEENLSRRWDDD